MSANTPGTGHQAYIAIAKESSYGVAPATAAIKYELAGEVSFDPGAGVIESDGMNPSRMSPGCSKPAIFRNPSIRFRIEIPYEGFEEMFRAVLATYSSAVVGGETIVIDHTFKEAGLLNSYTVEFSVGDIPTGKVTRLVGAYVTGITIEGEADRVVTAEITVSGLTMTTNEDPMSGGSFASPNCITLHDILLTAGNLKDGSGATEADIVIRSLRLAIEIPHTNFRPQAGNAQSLGPVRNGLMGLTVDIEEEWNAVTLMDAVQQSTVADLKFLFRNPATIGVASTREFEITAGSPVTAEYGKQIPGADVVTQRVSYRLQYNSTAVSAVVVRTRNLTAALT